MSGIGMARISTDAPRAMEQGPETPCCAARHVDQWYCTAVKDHSGPHVAYLTDGSVGERWDDPPEYDPDLAEAQRIAETYADGSAEHDRTEQEDRRGR